MVVLKPQGYVASSNWSPGCTTSRANEAAGLTRTTRINVRGLILSVNTLYIVFSLSCLQLVGKHTALTWSSDSCPVSAAHMLTLVQYSNSAMCYLQPKKAPTTRLLVFLYANSPAKVYLPRTKREHFIQHAVACTDSTAWQGSSQHQQWSCRVVWQCLVGFTTLLGIDTSQNNTQWLLFMAWMVHNANTSHCKQAAMHTPDKHNISRQQRNVSIMGKSPCCLVSTTPP